MSKEIIKQKDMVSDQQKIEIYENLLISLHTARWTHNTKLFAELMDKIAAYSYSRTNSNGYEEEEAELRERTLLALGL